MNYSLFVFYFSLSVAFSFCLGFFAENSTSSRSLAQSKNLQQYLSYEDIPCPSQNEIESYLSEAHITEVPLPAACDTSELGKTLKLFKLASLLQVNLPPQWAISHEKMLQETLKYISKSTSQTTISNENPRAIASNFMGQRIVLGPELFNLSPLKALEILVHENRHSSPLSALHVTCRTGDVPKTAGACDESYSKGIYTGAYSAGLMWSLAQSLYGINLTEETREELMNSVLSVLSTRFNQVPEELAAPLDLVFVLSEDRQVFQIHPFTSEPILVPVQLEDEDGIDRIQFDPIKNGFIAFTKNGRIVQVDQNLKQQAYYQDILPPDMRFVDSTKIYTSSSQYAPTYFLNAEGGLYYSQLSNGPQNKFSPYRRHLPFIPKKIIGALKNRMLLLSLDGSIYEINTSGGPQSQKIVLFPQTQLADKTLWLDISGGVNYEALYSVSALGRLYYMTSNEDRAENKVRESDFVAAEKLIKFQEGMNIQIGLSEDGTLYAWDYLRTSAKPWVLPTGKKVVDFAIGRSFALTSPSEFQKSPLSAWSLKCQVKVSYQDPWTHKKMGISATGDLIFEGQSSNPCISMTDYYKWIQPTATIQGSEAGKATNYFSQTYLEFLKNNNEKIRIYPYRPPQIEY